MTQILDGKTTAKKIEAEVAEEIKKLSYKPGLHVILVGADQASAVYVGGKEKATARVGIDGKIHKFEKSDTNHLLGLIKELNSDDSVDGILVQLPLPSNIDSKTVLNAVSPDKDVDGFHPFNVGKLVLGEKGLRPCTPAGVMRLLDEYKVQISGKRAVIVGRSNIVGKPMSIMLLEKHATVTICHSRTKDLCAEVKQADIVVGAIGKAKFIGGDWIKEGAIVIDVGINRTPEGKLCGDVDFESASKVASMITPVPGGVGPLTIAMLMKNTLDASKMRRGL